MSDEKPTEEQEPKLIIDEDWKSQVQAEKEAAAKKEAAAESADESQETSDGESAALDTEPQDTGAQDTGAQDTGAQDKGAQDKGAQDTRAMEIPPASFEMLVTAVATQAMAALGLVPMGDGEQPIVRLDLAKHHIDTLGVLEEKTKGNLNNEESEILNAALHQLRMVFVSASSAPATPPAADNPN